MKGLTFVLPPGVDKQVSVLEVGPFHEDGIAAELNKFYGTAIKSMTQVKTYVMVHEPADGLERLLNGAPFVDPIHTQATLNEPLAGKLQLPFDYVLQSHRNPGTSDMEGNEALRQALLALGLRPQEGDVGFFAEQHLLQGTLTPQQLEEVSTFLANPDLYKRLIVPRQEYEAGKRVTVPIVTLPPEAKVERFDVTRMTDAELMALNKSRKLAATLEEMRQFADQYRKTTFLLDRARKGLDNQATDAEIEPWFGNRSEHCFHKEFNALITLEDMADDPLFKRAFDKGWFDKDAKGRYVLDGMFKTFVREPATRIFEQLQRRGNNWIASMFDDNSGVVYYNPDYMFCIKFETHNSPSNKEPVQGAKTGIDGVNRDISGTGRGTFDLLANFFHYCVGNPAYKGWLPKGVKHPYIILKGITQGVREGGNESQVPTLGGGATFDPRYIAKCLVYCGTIGFSPTKGAHGEELLSKAALVGDLLLVAGQAVGVDGVHGATESSLSASDYISLGHVQADYSFIQAKNNGFIFGAARDGLLSSITDMGAMGLGSAAHEMARTTNGCVLDLSAHPVKYKGIQAWQVVCSETQDRMLLVVHPQNLDEIKRRAALHDVQVTQLGTLTDTGLIEHKFNNKTIGLIDIARMYDKNPRKSMTARWEKPAVATQHPSQSHTLEETLALVMGQPDVASKEWFFRQKDSAVKGATILGPLLGVDQEVEADATIQKPLCTEGKDHGAIAYALGITPKQSDLDPYYAAQNSFIDMVGKILALGGTLPDMEKPKWDAWAVCGNYCQPNSESRDTLMPQSGAFNLASLVREGMGIREAIEQLNIPIISGKDSMKCSCVYEVDASFSPEDVPVDLRHHITLVERDGKRKIEIHDPDSYLASCAVKIDDHRRCVDSTFKIPGDLIYIVGTTKDHMGASQYNSALGYAEQGTPLTGGEVPKVDFDEFKANARALERAIKNETVASCGYINAGGLLSALTKAAMAGNKGALFDVASIRVDQPTTHDDQVLFSETPGRFIVSVSPNDQDAFEDAMAGAVYQRIGTVSRHNQLKVCPFNRDTVTIDLHTIKKAYQAPLRFGLPEVV